MFYNQSLEENLLAILMNDTTGESIRMAQRGGVTEESFGFDLHRKIFAVLSQALEHNSEISPIAVTNTTNIPFSAILKISDHYVSSVLAYDNIERLRKLEAVRAYHNITSAFLQDAGDSGNVDTDVMLKSVHELDLQVNNILQTRKARGLEHAANDAVARLTREDIVLPLFPSHTEANYAFSLHKGEMMTIAARSGVGKTVLACQMALVMLSLGRKVLYVCTESTDYEIIERLAGIISGVPHYEARGKYIDAEKKERFKRAIEDIPRVYGKNFALIGLHRTKPTAVDMERAIIEFENTRGKLDCVVADYIQDFGYDKSMRRMNKLEKLEATIDMTHDSCISRDISFILLSQLNRTGLRGERPMEDQIKEAGKINEKSHIVSFLHRKKLAGDGNDAMEDDVTEFYSTKARNTRMFDLRLKWNGTSYISPDHVAFKGLSETNRAPVYID